jgi:hypothetical protein
MLTRIAPVDPKRDRPLVLASGPLLENARLNIQYPRYFRKLLMEVNCPIKAGSNTVDGGDDRERNASRDNSVFDGSSSGFVEKSLSTILFGVISPLIVL